MEKVVQRYSVEGGFEEYEERIFSEWNGSVGRSEFIEIRFYYLNK